MLCELRLDDDMGVYCVGRNEDGYDRSIAPGANLWTLQRVILTPQA